MKIIIVNRNYFVTGGPEKYMFTLMENMPQHQFIPFCVSFEKNFNTPYSRYFVEPPAGQSSVYFSDFKMSFTRKLSYAFNSIYNLNAKTKLDRLISDERPDLVLCLNAVYFSDSIIDVCRKHKVPIIWRLSDFHKICASYLLYRDGHVCEECLEHGLSRAVCNRCGGYQRSRIAACIKVTGMWLSRLRRVYDYVDFFVAPSKFTRRKMIQGGFDPLKIVHIPTMVTIPDDPTPLKSQEILFVGRLSHEKGVDILLAAFGLLKNSQARLSLVGDDTTDYAVQLKKSVPDELRDRITFHGFQDTEQISILYDRALCFVVPSVWYENQPNTVLEGMSHARPAVVSDLGSLHEMVDDGVTGYRFKACNAADLAAKLDMLLSNLKLAQEMGLRARSHVIEVNSVQKHLGAIDDLFQRCIDRKQREGTWRAVGR
ncbi:Glycosyl transferase, group 1 [uncultured Desulfobacterium sp.]|uniref:Glycosyl transferase, group 1 n=1 Tax=uncultured Desulfobacterium sp. TaxID=201089 RepID=A0A445MUM7_9BACT|nr:Glycosyl transferase, group 1 [uncultured Desulfobacterium sp.]